MSDPGRSGTVIAFDFGLARIGVAVGEPLIGKASALTVVRRLGDGPDWQHIDRIIDEWDPSLLLVGHPSHLDGSLSEMSESAEDFARELETRTGRQTVLIDERLSSKEARSVLRDQRRSGLRKRRIRRDQVDQEAARLLIEQWMGRRR